MLSEWNAVKEHARKQDRLGLWRCDPIHYHNDGELFFLALDPSDSYITNGLYFRMYQVAEGTFVDFGEIDGAAINDPFFGSFRRLFARTLPMTRKQAVKHVSKSFGINLTRPMRQMLDRLAEFN